MNRPLLGSSLLRSWISEIRDSRLGDDYARAVAGSYAEPESVRSELAEARALMKRLGCFVVRTDGKAIEESAAEIIAHLEEIQEARARRAARRAQQSKNKKSSWNHRRILSLQTEPPKD